MAQALEEGIMKGPVVVDLYAAAALLISKGAYTKTSPLKVMRNDFLFYIIREGRSLTIPYGGWQQHQEWFITATVDDVKFWDRRRCK